MLFKKILIILFLLFVGLLLVAYLRFKPYYIFADKILGVNPLSLMISGSNFKKTENKVNILLLGKAGANHEGPNLTDSLTVISYNLKIKKITLISIPRDVWSVALQDKVNSAYAYGEAKMEGGGFRLAKAEIGAVVGQPIHYAILVDFDRFKELIDFLGGIDVKVERSFKDSLYPRTGKEDELCGLPEGEEEEKYKCRFETISFTKGENHMNGDTALKFVRSRHAEGAEGSDYARNKRQQIIVHVLYQKIFDKLGKYNIKEMEELYELLDRIVERDFENIEGAQIGKGILLAKQVKVKDAMLSPDFWQVPDNSNYQGKYVLVPNDTDFTQIHRYIACMIDRVEDATCQKYIPRSITTE